MKKVLLSLLAGIALFALISQPAHARSYEQRARDITVELGYVIDAMLEAKPIDHAALKDLRGELERLEGELALDGHGNNRIAACYEMLNILVKDTARFDGMSDTDRVSYLGWVRITMDSVWQRFKQGELSDDSDMNALLPHGGGGMGGKRMQDMPAEGRGSISISPGAELQWKPYAGAKAALSQGAFFNGWQEGSHFSVSLEDESCIASISNGYSAEWSFPAIEARGASVEQSEEDGTQVVVSISFADGTSVRYMIANGGTGPVFVEE